MAAPATISLKINAANVIRNIDRLQVNHRIAVARALNRSVASTKVYMARVVADDMKMKIGDVKDKIGVEEATTYVLTARITASPERVPLIELRASGPRPSRGKGRGVRAAGKSYPNAFIATMKSGHEGVFARFGAARKSRGAWSKNLPIRELRLVSIKQVFTKRYKEALAFAKESLVKNLQHEMAWAMRQSAARS